MICWSCEKSAGPDALCAGCGAIQPVDPAADHFAVLGIGKAFAVDLAAIEKRYKEMSRQIHPDRFARADARARRASMERSVQLNRAYKTLRDPVKRAEYLLALAGFEVGGEDGTFRPAPDGSRERVPVPQELLLEVMELREGLLEARGAGDTPRVRALGDDVRGRRQRGLAAVAEALGETPADLNRASRELVAVRYYDRFLDELADDDEPATAAAPGVPHG